MRRFDMNRRRIASLAAVMLTVLLVLIGIYSLSLSQPGQSSPTQGKPLDTPVMPQPIISHPKQVSLANETPIIYGSGKNPTEDTVASVKIAPRQAVERTWEEAWNYGKKQGLVNVRIKPTYMSLDASGHGPVNWFIKYNMWDINPTNTPDPKMAG